MVTVIIYLAVNITARLLLAATIPLIRVVSVRILIDGILNHYELTDLNNS